MALVLFAIAALLLVGAAIAVASSSRRRVPNASTGAPERGWAAARTDAADVVDRARRAALTIREAVSVEVDMRHEALEARTAALDEKERSWEERRGIFEERRFAHKKRREEIEARSETVNEQRRGAATTILDRAVLTRDTAVHLILDRLQAELAAEHAEQVERAVSNRIGDVLPATRTLLVAAMERQSGSHADTAPRLSPLPFAGVDDVQRERLLSALAVVAEGTTTDLAVDEERQQATLRGLDPIGREVARQAALEVLDRRIQAEAVPPLLQRTRASLATRISEIGERSLWEMQMCGRPELAELMGVLHYRFSYGQNALLHCKETGYICGALAAELGMTQAQAREAGMLHDIGKAADHDVEGSHAIIGGELLRLMGTDQGIVHAVKAHHFDEEPSTDLAMLTICADAISASRPGARRDTLAAYLARLEQLQTIATRHTGVERAFPLQAGREVRIFVRARQVKDEQIAGLSHEIAREIEDEMQYPGVIKVLVIRETTATATAPAQVGRAAVETPGLAVAASSAPKRRRRKRKRREGSDTGSGETSVVTAEPA